MPKKSQKPKKIELLPKIILPGMPQTLFEPQKRTFLSNLPKRNSNKGEKIDVQNR